VEAIGQAKLQWSSSRNFVPSVCLIIKRSPITRPIFSLILSIEESQSTHQNNIHAAINTIIEGIKRIASDAKGLFW
jgi:hypothetical protein